MKSKQSEIQPEICQDFGSRSASKATAIVAWWHTARETLDNSAQSVAQQTRAAVHAGTPLSGLWQAANYFSHSLTHIAKYDEWPSVQSLRRSLDLVARGYTNYLDQVNYSCKCYMAEVGGAEGLFVIARGLIEN